MLVVRMIVLEIVDKTNEGKAERCDKVTGCCYCSTILCNRRVTNRK